MKIAVIITVFNRREKTLACLEALYALPHEGVDFKVYLTDDGSTDGTGEAVARRFPEVIVSKGDGSLYWAGGTEMSWRRAVNDGGYDGYLWLNDDTVLKDNVWPELLGADRYCRAKYGTGGIYVGSTLDMKGQRRTYGGLRAGSRLRASFTKLEPDGTYKECDIANGNITLIMNDVVKELGTMTPGYVHGIGDFDYTFMARRKGFPVLILKDYVGLCDNDHKPLREILMSKPLKKRIEYLYAPTGMGLNEYLHFQRRFFPWYAPVTFAAYWARALFPKLIR